MLWYLSVSEDYGVPILVLCVLLLTVILMFTDELFVSCYNMWRRISYELLYLGQEIIWSSEFYICVIRYVDYYFQFDNICLFQIGLPLQL